MKMITNKKTAFTILMILLICRAALAQPQKGIMQKLIEIKYSSELYLTSIKKRKVGSK